VHRLRHPRFETGEHRIDHALGAHVWVFFANPVRLGLADGRAELRHDRCELAEVGFVRDWREIVGAEDQRRGSICDKNMSIPGYFLPRQLPEYVAKN
jgi:hypothetical protein